MVSACKSVEVGIEVDVVDVDTAALVAHTCDCRNETRGEELFDKECLGEFLGEFLGDDSFFFNNLLIFCFKLSMIVSCFLWWAT